MKTSGTSTSDVREKAPDPGSAEIRLAERAFRRGYQQGAHIIVQALKEGCSLEQLERWASRELYDWRYPDPDSDGIGERDMTDRQLEDVLIEQRVMPPSPPAPARRRPAGRLRSRLAEPG